MTLLFIVRRCYNADGTLAIEESGGKTNEKANVPGSDSAQHTTNSHSEITNEESKTKSKDLTTEKPNSIRHKSCT